MELLRRRLPYLFALVLLLGTSFTAARPPAAPRPAELLATTSPPPSLRLNEVLAAPTPGGQEWVELINLTAAPVSLAGWTLDDFPDRGALPVALPAGSTLDPGAYLAVATPNMFDNLGSDVVRLIGPDGTEVDLFEYIGPTRGAS